MDTNQHSNKTELKDRTLWYDGDSSYPATSVLRQLIHSDEPVFTNELTTLIKQYNQLQPPEKQIRVKQDIASFTFDWNIPEQYKTLNVEEYLKERLWEQFDANPNLTDDKAAEMAVRVSREMRLYKKLGLMSVLQVLIFVINTLHNEKVVWGVGRGSSVSSYVLYLIGVHDVDSIEYGLNIEDFLH